MTDLMHDFDPKRVSKSNAGEFYRHPYGGIARDVLVSREGFARYFNHSVEYIDNEPMNMKLFDDFHEKCETYGTKMQDGRDGRIQYRITHIDHTHRARMKFHQQEMRKLVTNMELMEVAFGQAAHSFTNMAPYLRGA